MPCWSAYWRTRVSRDKNDRGKLLPCRSRMTVDARQCVSSRRISSSRTTASSAASGSRTSMIWCGGRRSGGLTHPLAARKKGCTTTGTWPLNTASAGASAAGGERDHPTRQGGRTHRPPVFPPGRLCGGRGGDGGGRLRQVGACSVESSANSRVAVETHGCSKVRRRWLGFAVSGATATQARCDPERLRPRSSGIDTAAHACRPPGSGRPAFRHRRRARAHPTSTGQTLETPPTESHWRIHSGARHLPTLGPAILEARAVCGTQWVVRVRIGCKTWTDRT